MSVTDEGDLISSEQVMERLMSHPTLRRAAVTCVLPAVRRGNEWWFRRSDLEAWVIEQLVSGATRES